MVDFLSPEKRSERMSRIRSRDTSPEIALRRELHALGFRYRLHDKRLPGKPDLVLPRYGAIVFVHGCFWHRHEDCKIATMPKSNTEFWQAKFDGNVARDKRNRVALEAAGWRVLVTWECELGSKKRARQAAEMLAGRLRHSGRTDLSFGGEPDSPYLQASGDVTALTLAAEREP